MDETAHNEVEYFFYALEFSGPFYFMFTGIIKSTAEVLDHRVQSGSLFLRIKTPAGWNVQPGDSVAADGACLTVKEIETESYTTELMSETLQKTKFARFVPDRVNLERSLSLSDVLDGHLVLGHVDGVGRVEQISAVGQSNVFKISFPERFAALVAEKGSIAVDGVSLTVVEAGEDWFTVSLVDYTLKHTILGEKQEGDLVNLEFDVIAKYLARIIKQKEIYESTSSAPSV